MSFKQVAVYPCSPNTVRGASAKLAAHKDKIVYTNGRTVIIRDLNNPSLATAYSGHTQNTTVARISPSGYYCASADVSGTVKIWDTVGEDQTLKGDYKVISGRINDLEWDGESKRIIAVGDGREKYGHVFMFDTGTTAGEIVGHSKAINAVSIRHQRPFRAATAADDGLIVFHQGTPYKYDKTIKTHTKFVQDVRYAPSGDQFASVGSDAKIFIYDGKTGDTLAEFADSPHKGTIMACSWSPDSKSLLTSSADCTVKLWDVETRKAVTTWTLGTSVNHQQVGNAWSGVDALVSLSMSGELNVFDPKVGDKPTKVLQAPQKSITSTISTSSSTFLAGTADGRVLAYDTASTSVSLVSGGGHSTLVTGMAARGRGEKVFTVGFDDRVREIDIDSAAFTPASVSTASQPKSVAVASDTTVFVVETNTVEAVRDNQRVFELKPSFVPSSVGAGAGVIAVGGEDQKVRLYDWDGAKLSEVGLLQGNKGVVSAITVSNDGSLLASGDSAGKIILFDVKERKPITSRWTFHTARITTLAFSPSPLPSSPAFTPAASSPSPHPSTLNSAPGTPGPTTTQPTHLASGSLDTHVYIWSVKRPAKYIAMRNAVPGGVGGVGWLGIEANGKKGTVLGAGADGCVRVWEVDVSE